MKKTRLGYSVVLGACLVPLLAQGAGSSSRESPFRVFRQVCAETHAQTPEVERVAREIGLREVTGADIMRYLPGKPGKAWRGPDDSMPYAVTVQPNGLCTVFVFAGDVEQLQVDIDRGLPPESSGIKVATEDLTTSPELKTTSYELHGGEVRERWVITISSNPDSPLRALLSWNRL